MMLSTSSVIQPSASNAGVVMDPNPLIPQRKIVGGESPPKVFKKKAPLPVTGQLMQTVDEKVDKIQGK